MTHPVLPKPTRAEVEQQVYLWGNEEKERKYPLQEKALNHLFSNLCPSNTDMVSVILKVSALNDFYSTNIFDTYAVAERIVAIDNCDQRLMDGDYTLVHEIAWDPIRDKNFYSFASKYCSHHNPEKFPIYDSYVAKMLKYYHKMDSGFDCGDLRNYATFVQAIKNFQMCYGMETLSLRDVDIFLWRTGKQCFPKKYKARAKKRVKAA